MRVAIANIQINLMMLEVYVVDQRRNLPGHEGQEMCLCKPLDGYGHAWIDRIDLLGFREIIRPRRRFVA